MFFKKFGNFHLIHLIVQKLDAFNFHFISFFCYCYHNFILPCEIRTRFLKNIHQKWIYYSEEKQGFQRFLIFFNIKMSAKSNKIELSKEFIVMWKQKQAPEVFCKKGVLRNFGEFIGKHLRQSLLFNKYACLMKLIRTRFLTEQLRAAAFKV